MMEAEQGCQQVNGFPQQIGRCEYEKPVGFCDSGQFCHVIFGPRNVFDGFISENGIEVRVIEG